MMAHNPAERKPNRLAQATSPYLLQHADNPVDWYEWGPEALTKAMKEDKPILVSIGYSSCHWCHVMERESFEQPDIAALMNEHFVCIKVDREERPDIDQVYMDAVQAMGLNGGWPLNVFLTPDQKPFYGGTYFQPKHWSQLIVQISRAYHQRRDEIVQSAEELTRHLKVSEVSRYAKEPGPFDEQDFHAVFGILESRFDTTYGGLERAPKFIMPTLWQWLLRYHHQTGNRPALEMVMKTLAGIAGGGIYDQLGGGFARYSVDGRWFAPHFEKMLYDNAQLITLFSEAYRVNPDERFRDVVYETIGWLRREMKHTGGGFFCALDADSEGEEGLYYTWTQEELQEVLTSDADFFCTYYQVTPAGNWEGRNILYRIGAPFQDPTPNQQVQLARCRAKLMQRRGLRVRPGLDDKILTGWNAMLITGLADAYRTFGEASFLEDALAAAAFLDTHLVEGNRCFRSFRDRRSHTEGFLEDYAHLLTAWITLYECTFDESWITRAESMCPYVIDQFRDPSDGFFFVSPVGGEKLVARKKDLFDNVIPSPNSVMARVLYRLGIILDREEWQQDAREMVSNLRQLIVAEPGYLSNWGIAAMEMTYPFHETVITGAEAGAFRQELQRFYLPFTIVMGAQAAATLPLVKDRTGSTGTLIHVCKEKVCQLPVNSVTEALQLLTSRAR